MAAMDELHIFFVGAKTAELKSVIMHIIQSHYPPSGNMHVILLKFKMATTNLRPLVILLFEQNYIFRVGLILFS